MNAEFILGRPVLNSVSMHLHVGFLIMEAVLEHPDRENAYRSTPPCVLYVQTGGQYALTSPFYFLKRNRFSWYKVCLIVCARFVVTLMQINKM